MTALSSWGRLKYPTTQVRRAINEDYNTEEFQVLWCEWVTSEEVPVMEEVMETDEHGHEHLVESIKTDETQNIVYETRELDRPKYKETRLVGFPAIADAYEHADTVRAMRYA